jgi:hypothetical protein
MGRTKPTDARDKILEAERMRRRYLELSDPDFKRELRKLETIAKRLAARAGPLVEVSELSKMSEKDLSPTRDGAAFHQAAERFKTKWDFQPRWTNDGKVELCIRSPVHPEIVLETVRRVRMEKNFSDGDVDALLKFHRESVKKWLLKKGPLPLRMRQATLEDLELKAEINALKKKGLRDREILNRLDRPKTTRWAAQTDSRYGQLYEKHHRSLRDTAAAAKATEKELQDLHRADVIRAKKNRDKLRYIISRTRPSPSES